MTGQDYKAGCPPTESSVAHDNGPADDGDDEDTVDPWNVSTTSAKGVDYDKLIGGISPKQTTSVYYTGRVLEIVYAFG